ncbi:hypothetical protein J3F83DRAFT_50306 [Trichoderma novae-zelandiae]
MSPINRRPSAMQDLEAGSIAYDDVFVDVGSRGYDIQSRVLGVPDHLGLFQRGAPRRNGFLGLLIVSFFGAFVWSIVLFMFYVVALMLMSRPMGPRDAMMYSFILGWLFVLALTMTAADNLDRRWRRHRLAKKMEKEMGERNGSHAV